MIVLDTDTLMLAEPDFERYDVNSVSTIVLANPPQFLNWPDLLAILSYSVFSSMKGSNCTSQLYPASPAAKVVPLAPVGPLAAAHVSPLGPVAPVAPIATVGRVGPVGLNAPVAMPGL